MKKSSKKPQTKFLTVLFSVSEGLSVLLSVLIISVIVIFSVGVTIVATDSSRQASNVRQGTAAYYAAEAGLEEALWINQKLAIDDKLLGAEESITLTALGGTTSSVNLKIQGTTSTLSDQTVNTKYIIPFPWTGNVPWNGEGATPGAGGCNPDKPPVPGPDTANRFFNYDQISPPPLAIEHPCNWGKLAVGEKVTIPLFGMAEGNVAKFSDFSVRLRTPCANNAEFCLPEQRMDLNCWDKGFEDERKCRYIGNNALRGEVVVLWQINAEKTDGTLVSMKPLENTNDVQFLYYFNDSQLYEGKINSRGPNELKTFDVLNTLTNGFPPTVPQGINLDTTAQQSIYDFINTNEYSKPVLTLSVVNSLIGCKDETSCNQYSDDSQNTSYVPHMIPYLEYQVVLNSTPLYPPVSKDNIITAEGQAGVFSQTIQVKAPNDSSSLEYVIQQ